jgi:hypothetical protein
VDTGQEFSLVVVHSTPVAHEWYQELPVFDRFVEEVCITPSRVFLEDSDSRLSRLAYLPYDEIAHLDGQILVLCVP